MTRFEHTAVQYASGPFVECYSVYWLAQGFQAQSTHKVNRLELYFEGAEFYSHIVYVSLRNADSNGVPYGSDIWGPFQITLADSWNNFARYGHRVSCTAPYITLTNGSYYAIVMRCPTGYYGGPYDMEIAMWCQTDEGYPFIGQLSSNSGGTWSPDEYDHSFCFAVYDDVIRATEVEVHRDYEYDTPGKAVFNVYRTKRKTFMNLRDRNMRKSFFKLMGGATGAVKFDGVILSEFRAAPPYDLTISNVNSGNNKSVYINSSDWTDCSQFTVPNVNVDCFWVHALIEPLQEVPDHATAVLARLKATDGVTTYYYPSSDVAYCPAVVFSGGAHKNHSVQLVFNMPRNVKNWTVYLQLKINYPVYMSLQTISYLVGWGDTPHTHT